MLKLCGHHKWMPCTWSARQGHETVNFGGQEVIDCSHRRPVGFGSLSEVLFSTPLG